MNNVFSKLVEFRLANQAKLEKKWAEVNQEEYTPTYQMGACAGFTHFVASEFVNHNNQTGEYVNV